MDTISIVGGGPAGLRCAELLAESGFDVSVFEEHPVIGKPEKCAGLVSRSGLEELGIKPGGSLVNEIKGAKIFSPGGESLTVERKETAAYVIDRFEFDQMLFKKAREKGAAVYNESKLIDLRGNGLFMEIKGHGEMRRSKITVGADGANSMVRHSAFGEKPEQKDKFVHACQTRATGKFDRHLVEVHFGSFAPGFFAWVIPESATVARIGTGVPMGGNPAEQLNAFIKQKNIGAKGSGKISALIPIGPPLKETATGNVMLLGDAAWHTKATTGGGIVFGLKAANACANTIIGNMKNRSPLSDYEKNLRGINRELALHWRICRYARDMQPAQMDALFRKAKKAGIERFLQEHGDMDNPGKFMRKMMLKPSMWSLLPAALRMI
ncbi:MAG: NAD(P)/FAD-dependent oxidoreductase [Candidatus Diapherotrites archaeon]|nr:NAD(P)/FAD-dependent oxidoreductase [Candidatus Diapherotrites archaeon]